MPLINKSTLCKLQVNAETVIKSYRIYNKSDIFLSHITNQKNCFYIELSNNENLVKYIHENIPENIKQDIHNKKSYLLISCEYEANNTIIERIYYDLILKHNLPESHIIYVTGTIDVIDSINDICNKTNKQPIQIYFYSVFEYSMHSMHRMHYKQDKHILKENIKTKKYICVNWRRRLHRPFLVGLLAAKNLLNYGHVSFRRGDFYLYWVDIFQQLYSMHEIYQSIETYNLLQNNYDKIKNIEDLYLDVVENRENPYFKESLSKFFETSYFYVVTETNYFTNIRFLTEKIFKGILYKKPFILVSSPFSLETFKSLGYKTFHPYINEDYDKEENHCVRMKMIVNEIERLCNLPEIEFLKLMESLTEIVEYNYTVLKNKKNIEDYIKKLT